MFKTKFKLLHATLVPIFPSCIKPIKRPWRFQSWAEQFLTNVHEAVSEVDQSNVQVMAHDKVLRPKNSQWIMLHWWRKRNASVICAAQNTRSCRRLFWPVRFLCLWHLYQDSTRWTSKIQYPHSSGIQARPPDHQKYTKSHYPPRSPSQTGAVRSYSEAKFAPGEVHGRSLQSPFRRSVRGWPRTYGRRLRFPTRWILLVRQVTSCCRVKEPEPFPSSFVSLCRFSQTDRYQDFPGVRALPRLVYKPRQRHTRRQRFSSDKWTSPWEILLVAHFLEKQTHAQRWHHRDWLGFEGFSLGLPSP